MNRAPKYRWIITRDLIDGSAVRRRVRGPRGASPDVVDNPARFQMYDDDGNLYYEGTIYGDYDGFEPLDDFGMPDSGCTTIKINGETL